MLVAFYDNFLPSIMYFKNASIYLQGVHDRQKNEESKAIFKRVFKRIPERYHSLSKTTLEHPLLHSSATNKRKMLSQFFKYLHYI